MLSDTVGFVRDLPHKLVASFRATLEEATHADLLLILLDVSDPSAELQYNEVIRTLDELFDDVEREHKRALSKGAGHSNIPDWHRPERLVLLNKVDRLGDNRELLVWQQKIPNSLPISALPSTQDNPSRGQDELAAQVREAVLGEDREVTLTLPLSDSRTLHTLETRAEILDREYDANSVTLRIRVGSRLLTQLRLDPEANAAAPKSWKPSPEEDTKTPNSS